MKNIITLIAAAFLAFPLFAVEPPVKEVEVKTAVKDGTTYWVFKDGSAKFDVRPGEVIKLVAHFDAPTKFAVHGLEIKKLNVMKEVSRTAPTDVEIKIPKDAAPGTEYPIGCQLHPTHKPATLVVTKP